jgi:Protein of unknown function (DUF3047)
MLSRQVVVGLTTSCRLPAGSAGRMRRTGRLCRGGLACACLLLAGCAQLNVPAPTPSATASASATFAEGWEHVVLPGKRPTRYVADTVEGRAVWRADADRSASMWRKRMQVPAAQLGEIEFSWRVDQLMADAIVGEAAQDDASARVIVAFDGDHGSLSMRNRMLFDLADTLTGERPPYATLMYVWADGRHPPETVLHSPRTDRVRKIVVESGAPFLGRWRHHRRNLAEDFHRAFGEPPGNLMGVALMTDSDNTGAQAKAWYADIRLHPR